MTLNNTMEKEFDVIEIFNSPKIICVVGNVGEAKSNLLYYLIDELNKKGKFNLITYGLKYKLKDALQLYSVQELEEITDSIIILDEVMTLFNLDNRTEKKQIENTLRLIEHNNNILVLCAVPENLKKFLCGKIKQYFFKKVTLGDFINGSGAKSIVLEYKGYELGSKVLNLTKGEALFFDGKHYEKINVPYMEKYDSKADNKPIVTLKEEQENVSESVKENVEKAYEILSEKEINQENVSDLEKIYKEIGE